MDRSIWTGTFLAVLVLTAAAGAQTPAPPASPANPRERLITVQEPNHPAQVCRVVHSWRMEDGTKAYQVQAVDSGEMLTIVESGSLAPPPTGGGQRIRAVATRIYHWGRNLRAPAGTPLPPDEMFASIPQAEKLPPGDTRVIMPTPPLTVSVPSKPLASENLLAAPSRLLPYRSLPAVAVAQSKPAEYPAPPLFMPKAEKLPPGETRVFPPASAEKPVAGSPYRTGVPAVTTSLQKKPAVGQTAPAVQTAPSEVSAPPAGERRWPAAFTGQGTPPQSESPTILRQPAPSVAALPVAAVKIPAAEPLTAAPRPAQGVDIPVAVPVKPDCGPVTSSVSGPCEPRRPLLKRWFGKKSCPEDPCAKDPCAKDPCAGVPSVAVKGTPMPSGTKKPVSQQKLAQPEPSKGFEQRPVAKAPTAAPEPKDYHESWGPMPPRKTEEQPVAKAPAAPAPSAAVPPVAMAPGAPVPSATIPPVAKAPGAPAPSAAVSPTPLSPAVKAPTPLQGSVVTPPAPALGQTDANPKKTETASVPMPPIPPAPRSIADAASTPAAATGQGTEKEKERWRLFKKRDNTKKPEVTARTEEKQSDTPAVKKTEEAAAKKTKEPAAKTTADSAKPDKQRPLWKFGAQKEEKKKPETPSASAAPPSKPADWGSAGKNAHPGTDVTIPQVPRYVPPASLPHAQTAPESDPLTRPSDFAKSPLESKPAKTDAAKAAESKAKTDAAKAAESKAKTEAKQAAKTPAKPAAVAKQTGKPAAEPKQAARTTGRPAAKPVAEVAQAGAEETHPEPNVQPVASAGVPPGARSVFDAGPPQYLPVPIVTVPDRNMVPAPPMPELPVAPEPNRGLYTHPNPLTTPPPGYRNAFTNPGPQNPVPSETIPPETSRNAFDPPQFEGQGTLPPEIPALMRNTATPSPGPIVPIPGPISYGRQQGMAGPAQGMPMQGMPMQGMPMQGMPQLPVPMQGMPQQQLPMPVPGAPMMQPQLPARPVQPAGAPAQPVPGVAWMPQQQFVPANYFNMPAASQVTVYAMPGRFPQQMMQPAAADGQANTAMLLQMLRESDYPSQREWAADQLAGTNNGVNPQVVNALVTAAKEDPAPMVRTQCVRSLTRMQVQTLPVANLLQQMQADSDPRVRDAVKESLAAMGFTPAKKDTDVQPASAPVMQNEK